MIASADRHPLTPAEYLGWEAHQSVRHEYVAGHAYATTRGTIPHSAITVNLLTLLRTHVRGSSCHVLGTDAKVRITESGPFFYPDVLVTCDERDKQVLQFVQFPCLVIEVLLPSTEAYDRGAKFAHYRNLESLQEF
ncbi:Uma2 family endonuclease, partial [bacterium]|nr:Uma2 family endonuclease [bacterium]